MGGFIRFAYGGGQVCTWGGVSGLHMAGGRCAQGGFRWAQGAGARCAGACRLTLKHRCENHGMWHVCVWGGGGGIQHLM